MFSVRGRVERMKRSKSVLLGSMTVFALGACADVEADMDSSESAATAAVCGNGMREAGEQCDDGNKVNLDGCSKTCTFEQAQRLNAVSFVFDTSDLCTSNVIGKAIQPIARQPIQNIIKTAVDDGSLSIIVL